MSQSEILDFLHKRAPNKYTAAQIIYHLTDQKLSESVVYANLKKLRENKEINWQWSSHLSAKKRPARYYFIE